MDPCTLHSLPPLSSPHLSATCTATTLLPGTWQPRVSNLCPAPCTLPPPHPYPTPCTFIPPLHLPFHTPESPSQSPMSLSHPFTHTPASSPALVPVALTHYPRHRTPLWPALRLSPCSSPTGRTTDLTRSHSGGRHGREPSVQSSLACPPRAAALLPDSSSWSPAASAGTAPVNSSSKCSPDSSVHTPEMITLDTLRDTRTNREKS